MDGDGLQRVRIYINVCQVKTEQIPLHDHAEEKEDEESANDLANDCHLATLAEHLAEGERHGRTAHEKEQGHDEVPETETFPDFMVKMMEHGT